MEFLRNHVLGLLEVEPLTFTCHATSDGTRVERTDAAVHPPSSSAGPTLNTVPLSMGSLGFDDPTPSALLGVGGATPVGMGATGTGSSSGLVMADSLKKLAQMYAKQLHPGYKQIHQLISDHVNKAIEVRRDGTFLPAFFFFFFCSAIMLELQVVVIELDGICR